MQEVRHYTARIAETAQDVRSAQAFRAQQFGAVSKNISLDVDIYDAHSKHVLIEDSTTGVLHACFRFIHFKASQDLDDSYSAQFYNLKRLKSYGKPMLEIGRFCMKGGVQDQAILRVAWVFLTRFVDAHDIALMFGCSSFSGTDEAKYTDAFALLKERHLAPDAWKPQSKAAEIYEFAADLIDYRPMLRMANQNMPPLLRTYLSMGGWVSDHAVVDRAMDTLHVFTGVEISAIPASRARLLRNDAGIVQA